MLQQVAGIHVRKTLVAKRQVFYVAPYLSAESDIHADIPRSTNGAAAYIHVAIHCKYQGIAR